MKKKNKGNQETAVSPSGLSPADFRASDKVRFWVSWWQPKKDYRPLADPPNENILGWWCSGYSWRNEAGLCAVVLAENEDAARTAVLRDWPEVTDWRFCNPKPDDFLPVDRFPLSDWMIPRFALTARTASTPATAPDSKPPQQPQVDPKEGVG